MACSESASRTRPSRCAAIESRLPFTARFWSAGPRWIFELLERARELQVRGLVVGAVPAELLERVRAQLLPVVATEGVGRIPMSKPIFNLLQANEGRETMMLAASVGRWKTARQELIIPLPASARPELPRRRGFRPPAGIACASAALPIRAWWARSERFTVRQKVWITARATLAPMSPCRMARWSLCRS